MSTCKKSFTIAASPSAKTNGYWTFAEPTGDWVDSSNGLIMPDPSSLEFYHNAGFITNGVTRESGVGYKPSYTPGAEGLIFPDDSAGISICFWFKMTHAGNSAGNFNIGLTPFQVGFDTYSLGGGVWAVNHTFSVPTGTASYFQNPLDENWHFVCHTIDGPTKAIKLYVDGVLQGTGSAASYYGVETEIFPAFALSDNYASVSIDELAINFNKVLSLADVQTLYNSGAGMTWPAVQSIVT